MSDLTDFHAWLATPPAPTSPAGAASPPTPTPSAAAASPDYVGMYLARMNAAAADRYNPLFPNGRTVVELPPKTGDAVTDYLAQRNAIEAAKSSPLRRK